MTISIPLSNSSAVALIDEADYALISRYKWRRSENGYAVRSSCAGGKHRLIYMHRVILNPAPEFVTDHIDGNRLNNTRSNLRPATRAENAQNRRKPARKCHSAYKGVTRSCAKQGWVAFIYLNRRPHYLGTFQDEAEAARAFDRVARKHRGAFASLNFPDEVAERDAELAAGMPLRISANTAAPALLAA